MKFPAKNSYYKFKFDFEVGYLKKSPFFFFILITFILVSDLEIFDIVSIFSLKYSSSIDGVPMKIGQLQDSAFFIEIILKSLSPLNIPLFAYRVFPFSEIKYSLCLLFRKCVYVVNSFFK